MKTTKRILILSFLLFSLFTLTACGVFVTRGSGRMESEVREVSGFDNIVIEGFGNVIITQGEDEYLEIEAEDNILPYINTRVSGSTLHIEYDDRGWRRSIVPTRTITFDIGVIDLEGIDLSGAADVEIASLETTSLDLNVSGAGNIEIDELQAKDLNVEYSGAGRCYLAGEVTDQDVRVSGLGSYDAEDLKSQTADIKLSGAGDVKMWAEDALHIEVSGAGNVEYWGEPRVTQDISGVGNIQSRGSK